jgi:hypothetical protein
MAGSKYFLIAAVTEVPVVTARTIVKRALSMCLNLGVLSLPINARVYKFNGDIRGKSARAPGIGTAYARGDSLGRNCKKPRQERCSVHKLTDGAADGQ